MPYLPIEDYGLIGNMHTAALVGRNGSIDWLCLPHFDSPSIFAGILDHQRGGRFKIGPTAEPGTYARKQVYWPDTNILITRFLLNEGVVEVVDYMPVSPRKGEPGFRQLVRRVEGIRGEVPMRMECIPAFNYARDEHQVDLTPNGAVFRSASLSVELTARTPLGLEQGQGGVHATFVMRQGEKQIFVLRPLDPEHKGAPVDPRHEQALFEGTMEFWHRWLRRSTYTGRWREAVHRSALTLKMLTFEPTGALVAAPTCSLPEAIPGPRNWDYRYTWVRDSAFSVGALLRLGFTEEAAAFMRFLEARCHERKEDGGLQIMYGIRGEHQLAEEVLPHLEGYRGSGPVRVGNGAHEQLQLDIYGELMDSVDLYDREGSPVSWDLWVELQELIDWVCRHWRLADEGIWETRGGKQHFVYSKLMCWVALDRALKLSQRRSFPADRVRWLEVRDQIRLDLMQNGWCGRLKAFVQHYGSGALDAANIMIPLVRFLAPDDPRVLQTLDAICRDPLDHGLLSNSLVYRYNTEHFLDGLAGGEGTFNMCTFWLVEALTAAGRTDTARLDQARLIFEKMLGYANHLGLYAEETGLRGEALGNYPQAFTHLGLISAAQQLDAALSTSLGRGGRPV